MTKSISSSGQMFQDPSELLKFVQKDQTDQKYHCVLCNKFSHKTSYCARNHVEAHHFPNMFVYPCDQCDLTFSTKSSITTHIARKHKKQQMLYILFESECIFKMYMYMNAYSKPQINQFSFQAVFPTISLNKVKINSC